MNSLHNSSACRVNCESDRSSSVSMDGDNEPPFIYSVGSTSPRSPSPIDVVEEDSMSDNGLTSLQTEVYNQKENTSTANVSWFESDDSTHASLQGEDKGKAGGVDAKAHIESFTEVSTLRSRAEDALTMSETIDIPELQPSQSKPTLIAELVEFVRSKNGQLQIFTGISYVILLVVMLTMLINKRSRAWDKLMSTSGNFEAVAREAVLQQLKRSNRSPEVAAVQEALLAAEEALSVESSVLVPPSPSSAVTTGLLTLSMRWFKDTMENFLTAVSSVLPEIITSTIAQNFLSFLQIFPSFSRD